LSNLLRISLTGRALDAAEEQFMLRVYERALRREFAEPSLTVRINFRSKGRTSMEPFVNGKALDAMLFHGKRRRRALDCVRTLVEIALLYSQAVEVLFAFEPDSRAAKRVEASFAEFASLAALALGSLYTIAATPSWFLISRVEAKRLKPEPGRGRYYRSFWVKTVSQAMAMPVVEELISTDGALVVDEGTTLRQEPPVERRGTDANIISGERAFFEL
jgi:hypothetical protein